MTSQTMDYEFLTPQEIADKLKVNKITIYRYIKSGKINAYKIGKDLRVKKDEFEKFLNAVRTKNNG